MFVHALSGAASFAACLRLFRSYPLSVSPCYSGGWQRSIVLRQSCVISDSTLIRARTSSERFVS